MKKIIYILIIFVVAILIDITSSMEEKYNVENFIPNNIAEVGDEDDLYIEKCKDVSYIPMWFDESILINGKNNECGTGKLYKNNVDLHYDGGYCYYIKEGENNNKYLQLIAWEYVSDYPNLYDKWEQFDMGIKIIWNKSYVMKKVEANGREYKLVQLAPKNIQPMSINNVQMLTYIKPSIDEHKLDIPILAKGQYFDRRFRYYPEVEEEEFYYIPKDLTVTNFAELKSSDRILKTRNYGDWGDALADGVQTRVEDGENPDSYTMVIVNSHYRDYGEKLIIKERDEFIGDAYQLNLQQVAIEDGMKKENYDREVKQGNECPWGMIYQNRNEVFDYDYRTGWIIEFDINIPEFKTKKHILKKNTPW